MESLFYSAFPPTPTSEWLDAIEKELGPDRTVESLVWSPESDLHIDPFYRAADTGFDRERSAGHPMNGQPGWQICDRYVCTTERQLSAALSRSQAGGADVIEIFSSQPHIILNELLTRDSVGPEVMISGGQDLLEAAIHADLSQRTRLPTGVSVLVDPLQFDGNLSVRSELLGQMADLLVKASQASPYLRIGCSDGGPYYSRGAGVTSTVAYLLASVSECGHAVSKCAPNDAAWPGRLTCIMPIGDLFYLHVAGLRALRLLLPQVLLAYAPVADPLSSPRIFAVSESGSPTVNTVNKGDIATPLIALTARALSAVLGGADAINLHPNEAPEDEDLRSENRRLVRNVQLLLKHESLLDRVIDPLAGSYYIENLTNDVAVSAWKKFLSIERAGGLLQAEHEGLLDEWIEQEDASTRPDVEVKA